MKPSGGALKKIVEICISLSWIVKKGTNPIVNTMIYRKFPLKKFPILEQRCEMKCVFSKHCVLCIKSVGKNDESSRVE